MRETSSRRRSAIDDGLVEVVAFALDQVGHRQLLLGRQRLLLHEGVVLRREDRHARGAGRQRQAKVPAGVGFGRSSPGRPRPP